MNKNEIINEVNNIYDKYYIPTLIRETKMDEDIKLDKLTSINNTIYHIESIINVIKFEDNIMYYEIEYWNKCLNEIKERKRNFYEKK